MVGSLMPGITGLWHKSPLRPCHPADSSGPWSLPDHGFLAFVHHLNLQRHYAHFKKFKQEGKLFTHNRKSKGRAGPTISSSTQIFLPLFAVSHSAHPKADPPGAPNMTADSNSGSGTSCLHQEEPVKSQ